MKIENLGLNKKKNKQKNISKKEINYILEKGDRKDTYENLFSEASI